MRGRGTTGVSFPLSAILLFCLRSHSVLSTLVNITVDDAQTTSAGPAIVYSPISQWSQGANCPTCLADPDASLANGGTWHDTTFLQGGQVTYASLTFNGSAIYVYCILVHSLPGLDGDSDMTFYIDGQLAGSYSKSGSAVTGYEYNVPVFANASLTPGIHSFSLQNGRVGGPTSLVLLDYMIYTQDNGVTSNFVPSTNTTSLSTAISSTVASSSISSTFISSSSDQRLSTQSSHSNSRTAIIAGSVCGGIAFLAILGTIIYLYRWRRQGPAVYPYDPPPDRDLADDPTSSGWAGDTWGPSSRSGSDILAHPSLKSPHDAPEPIRGDLNARERSRTGRVQRQKGLTESTAASTAALSRSQSELSHSSKPSMGSTAVKYSSPVAVEMSKLSRAHRHPYASRTPELDAEPMYALGMHEEEEEEEEEMDVTDQQSKSLGESSFIPSLHSAVVSPPDPAPPDAPVPTPPAPIEQSRRHRPLPMRPILELQARAARVRRQDSIATVTSEEQPPPPSYEACRGHNKP